MSHCSYLDDCLCADCDITNDSDNDTIALFIVRVIIDFTCVQAPAAYLYSTLCVAGYGNHEGGGNAHRIGELRD
jgi:hypothetical protein